MPPSYPRARIGPQSNLIRFLSQMTSPITHLIYDLDGLLLDTEGFYTQAAQTIAASFGKHFDWSIKAKLLGRPGLDAARILIETLELPLTPEDYLEYRRPILEALFPTTSFLPGAYELTQHLHRQGIPQAIATSSTASIFDLKTHHLSDWIDCFEVVVRGDDPFLKQGKPAPDIFLLAAQRLGAEPQHCLVFEDAPSGVIAAKAAGMRVIAVPDPHMDPAAYLQADALLTHLNQFEPGLWGLPTRD